MKGALLAFGGERGANIALMVEVLAAGVTGANWALDAPSFVSGSQSPASGLLVIAIAPTVIDPDFSQRMAEQLERLEGDYGVHIPGKAKGEAKKAARTEGIEVDAVTLDAIRSFAD